MSFLTNLTIRCPVCSRKIGLRTTKKPGILWGMCPMDLFRGFFPEELIKAGKVKEIEKVNIEELEKDTDGYYLCDGCGRKYKSKTYLIKHIEKIIREKEKHPRLYKWHKEVDLII